MATIDVNEILRSSTSSFRQPAMKKPKLEDAPSFSAASNSASANSLPSTMNSTKEDILAALENDESSFVEVDDPHIRKLVVQLEKKMLKNREMRVKNPDDPLKFLESEEELDSAIQQMHCLSAETQMYGVFIEVNGHEILLQLLGHENSDIVCTTLNLLQELTSTEQNQNDLEPVEELVNVLGNGSIIETFLNCLGRLDETVKDEADGVHNALSVVENMIEFREKETIEECVRRGLMHWLLKRAGQKGIFDANKLYASELLAVVLQISEEAKETLTETVDGIDVLLRAIAVYKKYDPESKDEREYMENLFDALCAALMAPVNRKKFLDGEGLQLMNLMLREKKQSRESALKVLDHATTGMEGAENCNKLVEMLGLRTLFPLFMRTPSKVRRKDTTPDEHEEHVCAILASLLRSCEESARERIIQKFIEHEHEKVDRVVELFLKYKEKIQRFELKKKRQNKDDNSSEDDPEREYLDKLENGLYTLQRVTLILADVCGSMNSARLRAMKLFSMKLKNDRLDLLLCPVLQEYFENLGDNAKMESERVARLLSVVRSFANTK
ncbi:unnamed protein product [Caenorhabditis auriculariae]|uniref:Beta-catenin-like protein 1 n=1 Tax=Caenorhabditis auriculariae TaxID=2777116 RepID=A0A8S1GPI5_9PELO|nr:unnamed protein product [Caenorhabditis auriculariae]